MTRFGEIPTLWQIIKNLKVYLVLCKVFNSLWHNLYAIGHILIAKNGLFLKAQFGHLVTLFETHLLRISQLPSVRISEIEEYQDSGEYDSDHAQADHGQVQPDVQLHELDLDDGPILWDLLADPDDAILTV